MAGEFGADAAGWGDDLGSEVDVDEHVPSVIPLGGGLVLRVDQAKFRKMMNSAPIRAQVDERGRRVAAAANAMAVTKGARYEYQPSTHPDNKRARGKVRAANYKAVVDNRAHSTLLKAAAAHTDPKLHRDLP